MKRLLEHLTSCEEHTVRIDGYAAFFADCETRSKRGEHQVYCDECNLYVWARRLGETR